MIRMNVEKKAENRENLRRKGNVWRRVVLALACVVAVATTYALALPAITMQNQYDCGKHAHAHTDACYEERDGERVLTCGKQEHIHGEGCLVRDESAEETYACGFDYEHSHGPECYLNGDTHGKLLCTLREHTHGKSCIREDSTASDQAAGTPAEDEGDQEDQSDENGGQQSSEEPEQTTPPGEEGTSGGQDGKQEEPPAEDPTEAPDDVTEEPAPDEEDTEEPTQAPDEEDTEEPTQAPTEEATGEPEQPATQEGDEEVTEDQAVEDLTEEAPTEEPSDQNTEAPTETPTEDPSQLPTEAPSETPTEDPSQLPTEDPSETPTEDPSQEPTEEEEYVDLDPMLADDTDPARFIEAAENSGNLTQIPDEKVKVTIKKEVGTRTYDVDPDIATGSTYKFEVNITDFQFTASTVNSIYVFWTDLHFPTEFDLRDVQFPEDFYRTFTLLNGNPPRMYVKQVTEGANTVTRLYFMSVGSVASMANVSGQVTNNRAGSGNQKNVEKFDEFDSDGYVYHYEIIAHIPEAVDVYNTQYCLDDVSTVTNTVHSEKTPYNGVLKNTFKVEYRMDGDSQYTTMHDLATAKSNSNDTVAYQVVGNSIYFFNRIDAAHEKHIVGSYSIGGTGDGWYTNWAQKDKMDVRITYTDNYGGSNVYDGDTVENIAYLKWRTSPEDGFGSLNARVEDDLGLVKKIKDDTVTDQWIVSVNESHLNLGTEPLVIQDEMENAELKVTAGQEPFQITRISANGSSTTLDSSDYTYETLTGNKVGFKLTIYSPGTDSFRVVYSVQKPANSTDTENTYSNSAHMLNTMFYDLRQSTFQNSEYNYDGSAAHFLITIPKKYQKTPKNEVFSNPRVGAEFTIYKVENTDGSGAVEAMALSFTENGSRKVKNYTTGEVTILGEYRYEGESDVIIFDSSYAGLVYDCLYYVQETKAPDGYELDDTKYYYYFFLTGNTRPTDLPTGTVGPESVAEWERKLEEDPIFHDSQKVYYKNEERATPLINVVIPYTLPETGGLGIAATTGTGLCLLSTAAVLYLRRKKGRGGTT